MIIRWWAFPLALVAASATAAFILVAFVAAIVYPTLPSLEVLTDYQPKIPLRVYSADGKLIGEFGEERRAVVKMADVPQPMVRAILAAEDERFYQHGGVDYVGVARAALSNFASGGVRQGASTITMQVARNFFLSKERTLTRKFNEMLLAFVRLQTLVARTASRTLREMLRDTLVVFGRQLVQAVALQPQIRHGLADARAHASPRG